MWLNSKNSESDTEPLESTRKELNINNSRNTLKDSLEHCQVFYFYLSKYEEA